jgi:hypothetical protein
MAKTIGTIVLNILVLSLASLSTAHAACPADIKDLAPGTWCEASNSHLRSVAYQWPAGVTYSGNGIGVEGVMDLWSSGAYDTTRDQLMVWGGGHNGYGGNEIYAFALADMRWHRLYDPVAPSRCTPYYSDGSPAASHSYGFLEYLPNVDRLAAFETGAWCEQGIGFPNANGFDPGAAKWEHWPDSPVAGYSQSAYDPVTGHAWVKGNSGQCSVAEFDPAAKSWQIRTGWEGCYNYYPTMVVDKDRRLLVAIGEGMQWAWDISKSGNLTRIDLNTTGDQTIVNTRAPGLAYDPVDKKIVGWAGGTDVFALDTGTWQWTKMPLASTNTVVPTAPNTNGTYGRFRYIPSKNAFVVVNSVDEDVYFYKLSAGTGTAPPQAPAKPTVVIK